MFSNSEKFEFDPKRGGQNFSNNSEIKKIPNYLGQAYLGNFPKNFRVLVFMPPLIDSFQTPILYAHLPSMCKACIGIADAEEVSLCY